MMQTGAEVIAAISKNTGIPAETLLRVGLAGYASQDISQFSEAEQQAIVEMASAAFGAARGGVGLAGVSTRTSQALKHTILTGDAPLSPELKGFIKDHCPCP